MTQQFAVTVETLDWRGVRLSITYHPDWLNSQATGRRRRTAHLEVTLLEPTGARLPLGKRDYRSLFLDAEFVDEKGGPSAYVIDWLDDAARQTSWTLHEVESHQLSLF